MSLDREPPDGDYAAYIDTLINSQGASPGAVSKTPGRSVRKRPWGSQDATAPDTVPDDAARRATHDAGTGTSPTVIRRDHNSHTEFENAIPAAGPAKPDSLGPHGSPRLAGTVQIVLGLGVLALFARAAVRMTYSHDPFSLDNVVPLLLLGVIARMFLVRGNAKLREARARRAQVRPGKTGRQHR